MFESAALVLFALFALIVGNSRLDYGVLAYATTDEDIKIAPPRPAKAFSSVADENDNSAQEYLRNKTSGNLSKAEQLGVRLFDAFSSARDTLDACFNDWELSLADNLLAYIVYEQLEKLGRSVPTLLPEAAKAVFLDRAESVGEELFNRLSDSAVFSVFMVTEDEGGDLAQAFAQQCGGDNVEELTSTARRMIVSFSQQCSSLIAETEFLL